MICLAFNLLSLFDSALDWLKGKNETDEYIALDFQYIQRISEVVEGLNQGILDQFKNPH